MSVSANFYKNDKRVNSTKLPTYGPGTFGTVIELKDYTNLFTPSLVLSRELFHDSNNNPVNPMEYNYCYIPDFKRYYFVRSWNWVLGRWECDLEVDLLASFRTEIGNTTAYVLRSASQYDGKVIDTKYPTKSTAKSLSSSRATIWETNLSSTSVSDGFFVIGIVNNDSTAIGAISYYAVNARGMRKFMSELYASPSWMNITDSSISTDLQKMLINPIQYINSCQWIPYALLNSSSLTQVTTVPVGWWNITINSNDPFYKLTGASLKMTFYQNLLDVPVHPQATGAFEWLKNSPYSAYQMQFYPFGVFPLDSAKLIGYNKVHCKIDVDLITGMGTLTVTRGIGNQDYPSDIIFSSNAQVGIPITMAQMSVDMGRINNGTTVALSAGMALAQNGALGSVEEYTSGYLASATNNLKDIWNNQDRSFLGKVWDTIKYPFSEQHQQVGQQYNTGATSGGSLLGTVQKVGTDIGNAILASSGTCTTTGTSGALAQYTLEQVLTLFYYELVTTDPSMYGYPLCQLKKISTLSGFVLCANEGDLSVPATASERQAISLLMKEGFFYE